jgi:hypothetical protein
LFERLVDEPELSRSTAGAALARADMFTAERTATRIQALYDELLSAVDEATGTPGVMEVNGRFRSSLRLATDARVDFPAHHLLARLRRSDANLRLSDVRPFPRESIQYFPSG